jgi:hypothetical protein
VDSGQNISKEEVARNEVLHNMGGSIMDSEGLACAVESSNRIEERDKT